MHVLITGVSSRLRDDATFISGCISQVRTDRRTTLNIVTVLSFLLPITYWNIASFLQETRDVPAGNVTAERMARFTISGCRTLKY